MNAITAAAMIVISIALAGCGSSPPSDEDVRQAIGDYMNSIFSLPRSAKSDEEDKKHLAKTDHAVRIRTT